MTQTAEDRGCDVNITLQLEYSKTKKNTRESKFL